MYVCRRTSAMLVISLVLMVCSAVLALGQTLANDAWALIMLMRNDTNEQPMQERRAKGIQQKIENKVAVCIVGELRSFGFRAVHQSILEAVQFWQADVYLDVTDRRIQYSSVLSNNMVHCKLDKVAISLLAPKSQRTLREKRCPWGATIQYFHINDCFRDAENFASSNGFAYDVFVRLRPDVFIAKPIPKLGLFYVTDPDFLVSQPQPDFSFAMSSRGLGFWRELGDKVLLPCGSAEKHELELAHPILQCFATTKNFRKPSSCEKQKVLTHVWNISSALIRGPNVTAFASRSFGKFWARVPANWKTCIESSGPTDQRPPQTDAKAHWEAVRPHRRRRSR